jgi:hypothetical protein
MNRIAPRQSFGFSLAVFTLAMRQGFSIETVILVKIGFRANRRTGSVGFARSAFLDGRFNAGSSAEVSTWHARNSFSRRA